MPQSRSFAANRCREATECFFKDKALSRFFKTEFLVLQRRPLGESDEILALLSPDQGRFDAVVRGSRRSSSSLVAKVEPFTHLRGQFAAGRKGLDYLNQAAVVRVFPGVRQDLERLTTGTYLLHLFRDGLGVRQPSRRAFGLLSQSLSALDQGGEPWLLSRWLEAALLRLLGLAPQLDCLGCGVRQVVLFVASEGGAFCGECRSDLEGGIGLKPGPLSVLRYLLGRELEVVLRLRVGDEQRSLIERVLRAHLVYQLPEVRAAVEAAAAMRKKVL